MEVAREGLRGALKAPARTALAALPDGPTKTLWQAAHEEGLRAQRTPGQAEEIIPRWGDAGPLWKSQATQTGKNHFGDKIGGNVFIRGAQGGDAPRFIGEARASMAQRLDLPTEYDRYPSITTAALEAVGLGDTVRQTPLNLGGQGLLAAEGDLDRHTQP